MLSRGKKSRLCDVLTCIASKTFQQMANGCRRFLSWAGQQAARKVVRVWIHINQGLKPLRNHRGTNGPVLTAIPNRIKD